MQLIKVYKKEGENERDFKFVGYINVEDLQNLSRGLLKTIDGFDVDTKHAILLVQSRF